MQLLMAVLPDVVVLLLPVGHRVQLYADALLYVPAPHVRHCPAPLSYLPATHANCAESFEGINNQQTDACMLN